MTDSTPNPAQAEGSEPHRRAIKSFVMRAGRMTEGQQRGLDQGGPRFILPLADAPVDFDHVFGRSAPRTLEIGFGMGHSLLEMAAASPEQDFIGVEVHRPGVGALLNGVLTQGLSNLRVYDCDAIEVLKRCIADASLDRLLLFFPDPWHKSRHHKRRIVQPAFAELVRCTAHGNRLGALCRLHAGSDERSTGVSQPGQRRPLGRTPERTPGHQVRAPG
jgi:tRNA (guanine-N7-)-methyltransferase